MMNRIGPLVAILVVALEGCQIGRSPAYLDDMFSNIGYTQSHAYHVTATLLPAVDREVAVREILKYLEGKPGARRPLYDQGPIVEGLRARDIWGLVLAQLTGYRLSLYVCDSTASKDEQIAAVVKAAKGAVGTVYRFPQVTRPGEDR